MPTTRLKDTKKDLCVYCCFDIETCNGKTLGFGDGVGHDNVVICDEFANNGTILIDDIVVIA
jgi:hypothetical protein